MTPKSLTAGTVLRRLKRLHWDMLGVKWAMIFGSLARSGTGRDVDLLVYLGQGEIINIALEASQILGIDPDRVDVVNAGTAPCPVIRDAWRHGIVVYEAEKGLAREWLFVKIKICHDYELARRKLGIVEEAARAVKRRWG